MTKPSLTITRALASAIAIMALLTLVLPGFAQTPAQTPATPAASTGSAQPAQRPETVPQYKINERIAELAALAPARQSGQPGLTALDNYFKNYFDQAAKEINGEEKWAQVQTTLNKADEVSRRYIATRAEVLGEISDTTKVPGALITETFIADREAQQAIKGMWLSGQIKYPTASFIPGETTISLAGKSVKVHQMAPNLVEPANLPGGVLEGPVYYVGKGTPSDFHGKRLEGSIILLDFNSGNQWIEIVQYGARAILFVEPPIGSGQPGAYFADATQKQTVSNIAVPRFYITSQELSQLLGSKDTAAWFAENKSLNGSLNQTKRGVWASKTATAEWLFIPGSTELKEKTANDQLIYDVSRQIVHVQAYKDSNSIVPALSPGASSLGNLASLIALVEQFKKTPPPRPVLISVVSDHTNALNGEQNYAFTAFADPLKVLLPEIDGLLREKARHEFIRELYAAGPSEELIEGQLRDGSIKVGGQIISYKEAIVDRLSAEANSIRLDRSRLVLRKTSKLLNSIEDREFEVRMTQYTNKINELLVLQQQFNKFGDRIPYNKLTDDAKAKLVGLFKQISQDATITARAIDTRLDQLMDNLTLRRRLGLYSANHSFQITALDENKTFAERYGVLPAISAITLDLTFGTDTIGFFYTGDFKSMAKNFERMSQDRVGRLAQLALRESEIYSEANNTSNIYVDSIRGIGGAPWSAYLAIKSAVAAQVFHEHMVPAVTLMSINDFRVREYTPQDTVSQLNPGRVQKVADFATGFVKQLIDSPDLGLTYDVRGAESIYLTTELNIRKQDRFSVGVPKMPQAGALALADSKPALGKNANMLGQVSPFPILMANDRGAVTLRGGILRDSSLLVFAFDPEYKNIVGALDFGMGEKRFSSNVTVSKGVQYVAKTVIATELEKIDLLGLTQPLMLSPAPLLTVIDAIQDSPTQILSYSGIMATGSAIAGKRVPLARNGTGSILVEPGMPFKLRIGLGLAINASATQTNGDGFSSSVGMLRNLVLTSANDMLILSNYRLKLLASKGVMNDTATAFEAEAEKFTAKAKDEEAAHNSPAMLVAAEEGRGLAYQVYVRALGTINDLIKAVVIFLALVIPFCFFLTKLISPFTDINRQLTLFGLVFAAMTIMLRFVHPAFEIARTPEVVILAFIILGLAIFVSTVLISKFNSSMNQIVEESQLAESPDAPQGRLAGVAFLVGINNMKRRRIRTTLTCVTIVLVTFTMLSVISVGQGTDPATRPTSPEAPYNGFLFATSGLGPIDPLQVSRLNAHYQDKAKTVTRAWAQKLSTYGEYLGYELAPTTPIRGAQLPSISAKVLLGLEVAENGFLTSQMPILPGGRWFSSNNAEEIVLSVGAAELMGIRPDNYQDVSIMVGGRSLKLIALLDDEAVERMRDQGDVPLLPMLEAVSQQRAEEADTASRDPSAADLGGSLAGGSGSTMARAMDVAFVPVNFARYAADADYRSLSVKFDKNPTAEENAKQAWKVANELIQFQTARIAVGLTKQVVPVEGARPIDAGQYAMASSNSTQVGGVLKIAVPIILAATIILNTMLGSVMERRKEVSIYNAIGLNPTHVMMFFLAESLVFGMIGSVAGYLIGQVLAIVFTKIDLGLNLNYSSLSVMVVIFLAIATVLISTIYPAMMAARAAVPSGQRKWSLPPTQGDEMSIKFPFSYDADRVLGVCAYLRDYMKQNSEASTGIFLAELGPIGKVGVIVAEPEKLQTGQVSESGEQDQAKEHPTYAMVFDVAPAPFDLGVNQKLEVYAYYDTTVKSHMLAVHITRTTGERNNWLAVNQPFLESLRKRLLGWRSQKNETHEAYYREGQRMFADAGDLPVVNRSQERA